MTFGLVAINDDAYVQIDSEKPRLCALYNGTYQAVGSRTATITFPAAVTSTEPPCIFIRNDPSRPNDLYYETKITGSSGNWTGFQIVAGNSTHRPLGKWFVAVFASLSKADFGLRMWASNGAICYDSGATPIIVTKANNFWTYQGSTSLPDYGAQYYFRNELSAPLLSDEYFMINPFSRGVLRPQSLDWTDLGVRFNYSQNRLQLYIVDVGQGPWADQGDFAAVFARLPGT